MSNSRSSREPRPCPGPTREIGFVLHDWPRAPAPSPPPRACPRPGGEIGFVFPRPLSGSIRHNSFSTKCLPFTWLWPNWVCFARLPPGSSWVGRPARHLPGGRLALSCTIGRVDGPASPQANWVCFAQSARAGPRRQVAGRACRRRAVPNPESAIESQLALFRIMLSRAKTPRSPRLEHVFVLVFFAGFASLRLRSGRALARERFWLRPAAALRLCAQQSPARGQGRPLLSVICTPFFASQCPAEKNPPNRQSTVCRPTRTALRVWYNTHSLMSTENPNKMLMLHIS